MFFQRSKSVPDPQKFVELVVVADNAEVNVSMTTSVAPGYKSDDNCIHLQYSRHGKETRQRILLAVNHVDKVKWLSSVEGFCAQPLPNPALHLQLYRRLNIRIVLVGLEIWSYRDLINVDLKAGTTLDNFLSWRQSDLLLRVQHDNAQFVT